MRFRSAGILTRWSGKRWFAITATLLGLSACGLSAAPGLGKVVVDQLQTDVVFGAEQPSPAPVAQPPLPNGLGLAQPLPSFFTGTSFAALPFTTCPTASPTSFPAQEAASDVTIKPTPGEYSWAAAGTYDYSPLPTVTVKIPVPPTFSEFVRNVQPLQETVPALPGSQPSLDFTFQSVEPQLGSVKGGYYEFFWQVKSNAQAGDPNGGLSLMEIDTLDSKGQNPAAVFKANPGLLLLPLPAAPGPVGAQSPNGGVQQTDVAVDTSGNGNTMQFTGSVGPRERVDACGTWLQAWPVDGKLQDGTGTATLHLDVATQFGGIVIAFNITDDNGTFLGTTFHHLSTHVGQASPSPLPKQWQ